MCVLCTDVVYKTVDCVYVCMQTVYKDNTPYKDNAKPPLQNTANRDIKLENTLLSGNLDKPLVKLCDMGFAKVRGCLHTHAQSLSMSSLYQKSNTLIPHPRFSLPAPSFLSPNTLFSLPPQHTQIHSAPDSQVGTPSYFAPEVVEQKRYDGRVADIWSCGVMLYVMLYGAYPFERAEDSKLTPAKAQQALLNVCVCRGGVYVCV